MLKSLQRGPKGGGALDFDPACASCNRHLAMHISAFLDSNCANWHYGSIIINKGHVRPSAACTSGFVNDFKEPSITRNAFGLYCYACV